MKILSTVARLLLGLMFTVFGLNGFLNFLPQPPVPAPAAQFLGALAAAVDQAQAAVAESEAAVLRSEAAHSAARQALDVARPPPTSRGARRFTGRPAGSKAVKSGATAPGLSRL